MKVLYLDESGDHNLNPNKINPNYPVFVLGGVIVERSYARDVVAPAFDDFKQRHFGRTDVILHTVDMGKGRGDYGFLADAQKRANFYEDLNQMLLDLDYMIVACVIRKIEHIDLYGRNAVDPYMYSLDILIERFCWELGADVDNGFICAEKRNPGLDAELLATWENLLTNEYGTGNFSSHVINAKIIGLDLKDKKPNIAGLQLADLVVSPIGRHVAGLRPNPNQVQWSVVETKLRRVDGTYDGRGLIIRPR